MVARLRPLRIPRASAWARVAACVAYFALCAPVRAQAGWSFAAGVASDKVRWGVSQNDGQASAMADLNWAGDTGWAAGAGLATLHSTGHGLRGEFNLWAGRQWQWDADWSAQATGTYYSYANSGGNGYAGYTTSPYAEVSAALAWRDAATLTLQWAPRVHGAYGAVGHTLAVELALHQGLGAGFGADAGIGWYDARKAGAAAPWAYGSLGLSWAGGPVKVFASRITSRADERAWVSDRISGDRWVLTLWWSF